MHISFYRRYIIVSVFVLFPFYGATIDIFVLVVAIVVFVILANLVEPYVVVFIVMVAVDFVPVLTKAHTGCIFHAVVCTGVDKLLRSHILQSFVFKDSCCYRRQP